MSKGAFKPRSLRGQSPKQSRSHSNLPRAFRALPSQLLPLRKVPFRIQKLVMATSRNAVFRRIFKPLTPYSSLYSCGI